MKIKFFVAPFLNFSSYQHNTITLAEGFRELGVTFYGNVDYWFDHDSQDYLIKKEPVNYKADVHIYNFHYFRIYDKNVENIDYSVKNIFIDTEDGFTTVCNNPKFSKFDFILRAHYCKNLDYPPNVVPWAFGLSNRIIKECQKSEKLSLENKVLINFRVLYNTRYLAQKKMGPILGKRFSIVNEITDPFTATRDLKLEENDKTYWWQTGKRHDPRYFETLNQSLFTYCFGGGLVTKPFLGNKILENNTIRKYYRFQAVFLYLIGIRNARYYINYQFDSWRFWEAMLSNSCPIHMNFQDWGFELPVMPVNNEHYIGVKGLHFKTKAKEILKMSSEDIARISTNGKKWCMEHYSPKPTAQRLLSLLNK